MKNLIEALTIFLKYMPDVAYPTACEHDCMYVLLDPAKVSEEDKQALDALGFFPNEEDENFQSFRYGSA